MDRRHLSRKGALLTAAASLALLMGATAAFSEGTTPAQPTPQATQEPMEKVPAPAEQVPMEKAPAPAEQVPMEKAPAPAEQVPMEQ
ncbi:MAG: hypothetical protein HXY22_12655, partial [Alphaproteobacteria bacterium]|nr:hypothetical protein [Alphaproteobacteria bacterium]